MSGRDGNRETNRGASGKRQPRRRTSDREDKSRAARGDEVNVEAPAALSFTPPKHEKAYYGGLFHAATAGARRRGRTSDEIAGAGISVSDASRFLALSGLPANHLQVMIATARSGNSSRGVDANNPLELLSKSDFFVAVRLVQLRQNHCRVTDLDLNAVQPEDGSEMKPPHFKGVSDISVPLPRASSSKSGVKTVRSASQLAEMLNEGLPETKLDREMTWPPEEEIHPRPSMRRSGSSQKLVTAGMEEIGHDSFNSRQSSRASKEKDRSSKRRTSRRDISSSDRHNGTGGPIKEKSRRRTHKADALDEKRARSHSASKLKETSRRTGRSRSRSGSGDGLRSRKVRSEGHLEDYDSLSSDSEFSDEVRKRRERLAQSSRPERGLKKSSSTGRLDKLERKSSQREKGSKSCCRACKERSEETSKMVIKVWEMEKEMNATRELVKELKAEVKALRKEARDRDLMLDLEKKDASKRIRRKMEKMRVSSKSKLRSHHERPGSKEKAIPKERKRSYSADKIREFASLDLGNTDGDSDEEDIELRLPSSLPQSKSVKHAFDDHSPGAQIAHEKGYSDDDMPNGDLLRTKGSKSERSTRTTKHDNLAPSASFYAGREENDSDDQVLGQGMLDIMNRYNNSMDLSEEGERQKPKRRNSGSFLLGKLKDRARSSLSGGKGNESIATGTTDAMPFDASNPRSVVSGFDDNRSFSSSRW